MTELTGKYLQPGDKQGEWTNDYNRYLNLVMNTVILNDSDASNRYYAIGRSEDGMTRCVPNSLRTKSEENRFRNSMQSIKIFQMFP